MKKSYLLLMGLVLLMIFAACSSDNDNASTNNNDQNESNESNDSNDSNEEAGDSGYTLEPEMTYHYFNAAAPGRDINTNETTLGALFEEQTGVNFRLEHIVGDMDQKVGVMVASGDYPDVIVPDAAVDTLLDAEAFIDLSDLLEEHGQNILEQYDEYVDRFTDDDGNIFIIPFGATINEHIPNPNVDQGAFWMQRAVLKDAGYPEVTTLDEYFDIITAYAEENPEIDGMTTIPFTGLTYDWRFFAFANAPNHLAGYPNDGGVQVDMETHDVSVYANSDDTKRYLQKLNDLNADGYLDQELFVMNYDEYLAKLSSGRVLGFFDYGWQFGDAEVALDEAGDTDKEFIALPIVFDEDIEDQYLDAPAFTQNRGIGITTAAENPERIIQYWDNMVREENQKLIMWGEEGVHYEVDEDGSFYRTDEQLVLASSTDERDATGMNIFDWEWPRINGTFDDGNAVEPRRQPAVAQADYSEADREVLDAYGVETYAEMFAQPQDRPWFPAWSANIEQGSDVQIFEQRSEELTKRHYPRIVLADPEDFEDEWNDFQEEYSQLDVDTYEAFFEDVVQSRLQGEW
ncbi:ABC transporter substrate-binding protein [Salipaludibacillus sp. HK11]|uniref:ABC transporter substrate-binding protein n=1 Tax=Salipaludibacillus sp. HK11 TaxID=3394320 RepID=UPI0039FB91A8